MSIEQSERYMLLMAMKQSVDQPNGDEILLCCPSCKYYEYRETSINTVTFVHCQNADCLKVWLQTPFFQSQISYETIRIV
jgi:hypothetical protein